MAGFFSRQHEHGDDAPIPLQPVEQPNIYPPDDIKYAPSVDEYHDASRPVTRRTSWGPGYVFYAWKWEMTAWLCAVGLFASMLAVLALHFQYFDSGSRGIWGAGRLLPIAIRRSPTALAAAFVIVVSFAVGPFIQQAIGTMDLEYVLLNGDASLPISRSLDGNHTYYRTLDSVVYGMWDFKYTTRAGLITALANPESDDTSITPTCT